MTLQDYFLEPHARKVSWDVQRNDSPVPAALTIGSKTKVWWQCDKGHSWQAAVFSVATEGCGCPYCAGRKAIPGENDLATVRPDLMKQWDYEKNGSLDPQTILPSQHLKAWWRCDLGHSWQAAIFSRTRERGGRCPYCTGKKVLPGFNDLATLYAGLAKEWHSMLNGDLRPENVSPGSNKKVWWQCNEHHVWQTAVYARTKTNGTGCPVCAGRARRSHLYHGEEKVLLTMRPGAKVTMAPNKDHVQRNSSKKQTRREAV